MGLSIIVPGADFSAIAVRRSGLVVSYTPSHLFELRASDAVARRNRVTGVLEGSITGSLSYSAFSATVDENNRMAFGCPQTAGSTVALVVKNEPSPASDSMPVGIFTGAATTAGAGYFLFDNTAPSLKYETTTHVGTAVSSGIVRAQLTIAGSGYELFFVTFDNTGGLTLRHPRTGASNNAAMPVGRTFTLPVANSFEASPVAFNGSPQEVLMFAKWPSVLDTTQMDTVYAEAVAYYSGLGVSI